MSTSATASPSRPAPCPSASPARDSTRVGFVPSHSPPGDVAASSVETPISTATPRGLAPAAAHHQPCSQTNSSISPDVCDAHRSSASTRHMTHSARKHSSAPTASSYWSWSQSPHHRPSAQRTSTTWLHHPDVLLRILSHLDKPTLLQSQRVSRAFAAAATQHIWCTLTFHNFHGFLGLLEVAKILTRSATTGQAPTASPCPYGKCVRSLHVYYSNAQKGLKSDLALDRPLALVTSQCPNLISLVLHVHDPSKLSTAALQQVLINVSGSLRSLDLALAPSFLLDPLLRSLPPSTLAHVEHIALSGACVGDSGLHVLGAQARTGLKSLALRVDPDSGPRHLTYEGIVDSLLVPHAATLERIELKGIVWPGSHPYAAALPTPLPALNRLHISLLAVPSSPTGSEIVGLVRAAADSLLNVCLVGVGGDVIERIAPYLKNVTNLELLHSTGMSVTVCKALAGVCKKLRQFRVVGSGLDDEMMCVLAVGKTRKSASKGSSRDAPNPKDGCLSEVRDLDLQAVYGVTDAGIQEALPALTRLRWLRLIDCPRISESSVIALCRASPNCETLHLSGAQFTVNIYWLAAAVLHQLAWVLLDDSTAGTAPAPDSSNDSTSASPPPASSPQITYVLDESDWVELVDTLPRVARAIHHGWILAAQGVATQGKLTNPGAPSTGTSTATVSGSPFGPVLLTPTATAKVAEAAAAAIGSQTRTAGVVIGSMGRQDGTTNSRVDHSEADRGRRYHHEVQGHDDELVSPFSPTVSSSSPSLSPMPVVITPTCIQAVQRKELFRPVAHPMTVMTPNPKNPYVMQNI
ncbi:hypothetical protein BCR44DRAFT_38146 [Catenaria anguillulae PL171]|uniref:F-box domain-containing protein n=1 Tax=Catenaria anguillulae PL171 TaxID=765915 RepID=A0A1Y2I327_9FUNG|nr:hypothetical protein BCR44DRAFT_38146 [Catenaria anguillulae PL171]